MLSRVRFLCELQTPLDLVDIMTNRGTLMSIDRFGINRGNIGPLAKCSFEESTDQLFRAAIYGEEDNLTGVSSNIMMGQIPPSGTGATKYIIDESKMADIVPEDSSHLRTSAPGKRRPTTVMKILELTLKLIILSRWFPSKNN